MMSIPLSADAPEAIAPTTPILEIRNVTKDFGGVRATDDLSLSIAPGELHCMIGPNGAGKSTFFKLLMGTIKPTKGRIFFNGEDITRLAPYQRARRGLGIKFQNMQVYFE
ncbi:MAG: ATP-binding cassette domain-containing protein, partial [Phycisphaerales bacterium]